MERSGHKIYHTYFKEAQTMKVYVLYNQRFCEIRGVYSTHELAMENAEYGTDFVFECTLDQVFV